MADRVPSLPLSTDGVDPRVSLATAIHAGRGVYAVLAGSGLSTSAGVKTGWQVVQELIRRVAAAAAVGTEELGDEPDKWWTHNGRHEPRYDTLVEALAPTDAARQLLLRQ
jgi:hypothetical protein